MPYYTRTTDFTPYTKVTSSEFDAEFTGIESAFALLPSQERMDSGNTNYVVAGGTADALTITSPGTAITTYTGQDGLAFSIKATATNTGATTINVDGVGAVSLVMTDGSAALAGGISTNGIYSVVYNETTAKFIFSDASGAAASAAAAAASAAGVNMPTIGVGDGLKPLRANAGETGYELFTAIEGSVDYQEFTSSNTWTKPANAISVYIECIGGGGGGGNATASTTVGAGGGGGFVAQFIDAGDLGSTETVTIGAGGDGGAAGGAGGGAAGGNTSIGSIVADGAPATGGSSLAGNGGGGELGAILSTIDGGGGYSSGGGGAGSDGAGNCMKGGAGGGGASSGTGYSGGASREGGNGGGGVSTASTKGGNGVAPGGGGGASSNDGGGGDGAAGRVRIWTSIGG